MGGGWALFVSADLILVRGRGKLEGGQQGVHRQPDRGRRIRSGDDGDLRLLRNPELLYARPTWVSGPGTERGHEHRRSTRRRGRGGDHNQHPALYRYTT